MKELDYGAGYQYAHEYEDGLTDMQCLPDALVGKVYYNPTTRGKEARVGEWMKRLEELRRKNRG
jgi:putative ATPase